MEQQADCFNSLSASSLNSAGGPSAILTDSKRYLGRIIAVFSGAGAKYGVDFNPVDDVASACARAMAMFGDSHVHTPFTSPVVWRVLLPLHLRHGVDEVL